MAQFKFTITINAENEAEAQTTAQYIQGVVDKIENKKLTKLLVAAFNKPTIIDKALFALKIM